MTTASRISQRRAALIAFPDVATRSTNVGAFIRLGFSYKRFMLDVMTARISGLLSRGRVARQVVENMFGAAEGWLGVDHPVLLAKFPEQMAECARWGKFFE